MKKQNNLKKKCTYLFQEQAKNAHLQTNKQKKHICNNSKNKSP